MKVIKNKWIPFKGFTAINLFGYVLTKRDKLSKIALTHEAIHTAQMREMLYVFFYLWYAVEFIYKLVKLKNWHKAYRSVSFEREAYMYEGFDNYIRQRKPYHWGIYL